MRISDDLIWHQVSNRTWENRYLLHFTLLSELIYPKSILSFGCSTGEECQTLEACFPRATIYGTDINDKVLSLAKQKYPSIHFISPYLNPKTHTFDAISAMNVLHRRTKDCEILPPYSRTDFDTQIQKFHHLLNPGGHLILFKSEYSDPQGFELVHSFDRLLLFSKNIKKQP